MSQSALLDAQATALETELKKRNIELPSLEGRRRIAGFDGRGWNLGNFFPDSHQPYIEEMQRLLDEDNAHQAPVPLSEEGHVCGGWCMCI